MKPNQQNRGSIIGVVLAVMVVLGLVVFAALRLNNSREQLAGQVDTLQSDLAAAQTRLDELQSHVNAERAAREQARVTAQEAETAALQAGEELLGQHEKLGNRIQGLETHIQGFEQRVAAAVEARATAQTELTRQAELLKSVEQELADVRSQLSQPGRIARAPSASGSLAGTDTGAGTRAESAVAATEPAGARETGTNATKQAFAEEDVADTHAAFDSPPKPVNLVSPDYPRALKQQGTEGNVVVAFTVDTRGRVHDVAVQEATNSQFEAAAVAAVRKWRFKPALRDGEPVAVRLSQQLNFTND